MAAPKRVDRAAVCEIADLKSPRILPRQSCELRKVGTGLASCAIVKPENSETIQIGRSMHSAFETAPATPAIPITFVTKATWDAVAADLPSPGRQFALANGFSRAALAQHEMSLRLSPAA